MIDSWIPEPLHAMGPLGLVYWQWLGFVGLLLASFALGRILAWFVLWGLRHLVLRSEITWDDELLDRVERPTRWLSSVILARLAVPLLALDVAAEDVASAVMNAAIGFGILRMALAIVDVGVTHMTRAEWARERPSSRSLLVLGGRIMKVAVVIIALIAMLAGFGIPVASMLAGLGIGGIALAFGAQKTVENLFGAFALGVDQPLREGDFVQIDNSVLGTVELIGLRSTRVRTLDRTLVSLPNGRVSDMRIETYAARDRCRMHMTIGLVYATTATQLRAVLDGFESTLRAHPAIWPDDVIVKLVNFGDSALEIEVMTWFVTTDYGQFRGYKQEVLLGFIDVIEAAGTELAFPTRTLHLHQATSATAERTRHAPRLGSAEATGSNAIDEG
jgi:MscS family membrane protein